MFIHNLKYAIKTMLKNKTAIIWTLLFPIALGTFMYMAFGNIFEQDMLFNVIPVAVVETKENEAFEAMLTAVSEEGEDRLLDITYLTEREARAALEDEEVDGVIFQGEELTLLLAGNDYSNTVLKSILDEYKKQEKILVDIAVNYPMALPEAIENLTDGKNFYTEKKTTDGNQDMTTNYFYAIFAMSCLFASFGAIEKVEKMQANVSALGMRRALNPNNKMGMILAEFVSMLMMQFTVSVIALLYFMALGIEFGAKVPAMLGILLLGSCIGIAIGIIIGASRLPSGAKTGISISIGMALSVMSDLVAAGVKDSIEHVAPIINRLNPAALIVDSFYALNVYDTYDRYFRNMAIMAVMTVVLLFISYRILRRNKYASV